MISIGQSDLLNLARWLAALLVVMEHLRSLLFQDFHTLPTKSFLEYLFYFSTGFGHEAVVLFFVISGFLVGGRTLERWSLGSFSWQSYLIDRASRLYAVYIFALFFGLFLDTFGSRWLDSGGYYTASVSEPIATLAYNVSERLTIHHFLSSLFMLQEIVLPSLGSNGPLWSLAHESWYYLFFPLLLQTGRGPTWVRGVALGAVVMLACFLTSYILILFGVWLLGVFAWKFNDRRLLPTFIAFPIFIASVLFMRLDIHLFPYAAHFAVGVGFALLLNSVCAAQTPYVFRDVSKSLADFSYSLYLIHFPVILLLISLLFHFGILKNRLCLDAYSMGMFSGIILFTVWISFLVSRVTEARTMLLRNWMRQVAGIS